MPIGYTTKDLTPGRTGVAMLAKIEYMLMPIWMYTVASARMMGWAIF